ncbi:MAG: GNAT family N-acetyltransferase [Oscillospiraceae bacterium]|nr:GNAT family N-acetyltransferase [Oscillospiraceae bacterium]
MTFFDEFAQLSKGNITLRLCEQCPGDDELLPFYYYDICDANGNSVGKISIRIGDNVHSYYNGHVGYEVDEAHQGKGYARQACELVLPIARAHGMHRVYLTCGESNAASRKVIEALGAQLLEIAQVPQSCFFWRLNMERYCIYRKEI